MDDPKTDLRNENERLRDALNGAQSEIQYFQKQLTGLRTELERQQTAQAGLDRRLVELSSENQILSEQYFSLDEQIAGLAHLYVATRRLHESSERSEVLLAIQEVVANFVGSEELAIFNLAQGAAELTLIESVGIDTTRYARVPLGSGPIGQAAASGTPFVADTDTHSPEEPRLTACIPLLFGGRVNGAIAIFGLLPQKRGLEATDRELFGLLATHAAIALHRASARPVAEEAGA